ncbi:hypothetical protein [Evansella tamaricis]|uniref:Uncharacterized protein n=1 Tax=Evansella tamaricis TaxID=2069301 RepID=A0ABS6JMM2_9BACI|nr:hypothetical protein [Evansella tamaricis]MBU9714783.1 hypothetical protein [Evansella tamaricis]
MDRINKDEGKFHISGIFLFQKISMYKFSHLRAATGRGVLPMDGQDVLISGMPQDVEFCPMDG